MRSAVLPPRDLDFGYRALRLYTYLMVGVKDHNRSDNRIQMVLGLGATVFYHPEDIDRVNVVLKALIAGGWTIAVGEVSSLNADQMHAFVAVVLIGAHTASGRHVTFGIENSVE